MTTTLDYYQTLGLSPGASDDEIKKAYRRLAREHHPDRHQGPAKERAEARFKEISAAYDVLSDPDKRRAYDQMRSFNAGGFQQAESGYGPYTGSSWSDFLDTFLRQGQRQDSEAEITLSLEEAVKGTSREIANPRTGGRTRLRVKIPPGVETGSKVRVPLGSAPLGGELLVTIRVNDHPLFERKGDDLWLKLPLNFIEALDGAEIEVPTLDGAVMMKIPPRTQTGKVFRLKGKGVPHLKGGGRGDLYLRAEIHLPPQADEQELALWRRLASLRPYDPRAHLR